MPHPLVRQDAHNPATCPLCIRGQSLSSPLSYRTLETMCRSISSEYFGEPDPHNVRWEAVDRAIMLYVFAEMKKAGKAVDTINLAAWAFRSILKEAFMSELIPEDQTRRYTFAIQTKPKLSAAEKVRSPVGQTISSTEIVAMINLVKSKSEFGEEGRIARDAAVLAIMYFCGLRSAEVCDLKYSEYQYGAEGDWITFTGKGAKVRTVALHPDVAGLLRSWLHFRGDWDGVMFPRYTGRVESAVQEMTHEPLSSAALRSILELWFKKAGLQYRSPHNFRRSMITNLLSAGTDPFTVAKIVGHSDPQTTMRYDKRMISQAAIAIQQQVTGL